jgi:serine/threonine protein kinase
MSPWKSKRAEMLPLADRQFVDSVCDQFEAAWRGGERPDMAAFLDIPAGPTREALFRELMALELDLRRELGECPDTVAFRERFPEFINVLDQSGTTSIRDVATVLGRGAVISVPEGFAGMAHALSAAGYEIVDELGRGGMGVVFRARQVALNRDVALKVIRDAGFASDQERQRFRNEAEAVAQFDHPGIVTVYEVGCCRGLDYFSMQLVDGVSLDRRIEMFRGDPRAAARLVATVAEAVHHAHQRGILHRDLKPANILLDERGQPHVTDFGLARRLDPNYSGDGHVTLSGAILGTPSYMSPEQAAGVKGAITTAADVYGLGAVLYAVLTGRAPHAGSSVLETLDLVRDAHAEPPSKINPRVPRDLEVVCLKCLEKDPKRRYPSARELADDLSRWLSGQPVSARPVGPITRFVLWGRRHPLPTALAALLAISLFGGFGLVTWKWVEADREASKKAKLVAYLTRDLLDQSSAEVNRREDNLTLRELLDRTSAKIGVDFQNQPELEAVIRETIGSAYLSLGEYERAEPHLVSAVKLDTEWHGAGAAATIAAQTKLASLWFEAGRASDAKLLLHRVLDLARRTLSAVHPETLEVEARLGGLLRSEHRFDEAEPLLRHSLDTRRRVLPPDHVDTLRSVHDLCMLMIDQERFDEAEALALEYEHGIRCARGPKHPDNIGALAKRGLIRELRGRPDEAEPFYRNAVDEARRILGPDHPRTLAAASEHARVVADVNRDRN